MDNSIIIGDIEEIWSEIDLRPLAGKSILITGATGLIGTYFIYSLLKYNAVSSDKVTIRVVTYRGLPTHLKNLSKESNVEIYKGNLQEKDFCMSLPVSDYIIHAAGYSQIMEYKGNLIGAIRLNTATTDALFERLNPNGGRILFVSSGAVYTGSTDFPHKEETIGATMPNHKRAPYIEGKRCGEAICHTHNSEKRIAKIARLGFTYGPGVRASDERALYDFIRKALKGEIVLRDEGDLRRRYCYVADAVSEMWNIFLYGKEITYNVDTTAEILSLREVADIIGKFFNVSVKVPKGSTKLSRTLKEGFGGLEGFLSIDKVLTEFKKKKFVSLNDGLERTIKWYTSNYPSNETETDTFTTIAKMYNGGGHYSLKIISLIPTGKFFKGGLVA